MDRVHLQMVTVHGTMSAHEPVTTSSETVPICGMCLPMGM